MRRFERKSDGTVEALLDSEEAVLLQSLAGQVAELVAGATAPRQAQGPKQAEGPKQAQGAEPTQGAERAQGAEDPALARLLPDAYPDDAEASAEFRRFTEGGLADRKLRNAETVIRSLNDTGVTGRVTLDAAEALAWLRCLTDIRLTIAARLGIDTEDADAGRSIDPLMREIYDWLGFVQNSLIEALDGQADHG